MIVDKKNLLEMAKEKTIRVQINNQWYVLSADTIEWARDNFPDGDYRVHDLGDIVYAICIF